MFLVLVSSVTAAPKTVNITTYVNDGTFKNPVCSSQITASNGTLNCQIPLTYTSGSFVILVYENGVFKGSRTITLKQVMFAGSEIMLSVMMITTLVGLGASSGIGAVVFGVVGLIATVSLGILTGGSIIGMGSGILWVIIAALLLIHKMGNRIQ